MTSVTTKPEATQPLTETVSHLFDDWFDPIEAGIEQIGVDVLDNIEEQYPDWVNDLAQEVWRDVGGWC